MKALPVLITIPHGGRFIPDEINNRIAISPLDILHDSDAFTDQIYDIGKNAAYVLKADIVRAIVDLNRPVDQIPPDYIDGVIKSHTCYGKQIYKNKKEPDSKEINKLIENFYMPYHKTLQKILKNKNHKVELALDCHSMAAIGPEISKDKGKKRPLICLGNLWNQTCSESTLKHISDCFIRSFGIHSSDVQFNQPFAGGYITKNYGNSSIAWIQIEINRALYLTSEYFNSLTLQIDQIRLTELNNKFHLALSLYFNER